METIKVTSQPSARELARKIIRMIWDAAPPAGLAPDEDDYEEAEEALGILHPSQGEQWVKCEERLPRLRESVLLAIPTWRENGLKFEWHFEVGWKADSIMFDTEAANYDIGEVAYWQEIKPPAAKPSSTGKSPSD